MPYIESPGFWGSLSAGLEGGVNRGMEINERNYARKQQEEQIRQARIMQQLGILGQVREAGGEVDSQYQQLLKDAGIDVPNLAPTQGQRRERIVRMPQQDIKTDLTLPGFDGTGTRTTPLNVRGRASVTDDEYRLAGLPTSLDRAKEDLERITTGTKTTLATGGEVDPGAAAAAGVTTRGQALMGQAAQVVDFVNTQAPNYVKEWIAKKGGRIGSQDLATLIEQSYGAFVDRFGKQIPDAHSTDARAAFGAAAMDVLMEQNKQDLDKAALDIQRYRAGREGSGDQLKYVDTLNDIASGLSLDFNRKYAERMSVFMDYMMSKTDPRMLPVGERNLYMEFSDEYQRVQAARAAAGLAARGLSNDPRVNEMIDFALAGRGEDRTQHPPANPEANWERDRQGRIIVDAQERRDMEKAGVWDSRKYVVQ